MDKLVIEGGQPLNGKVKISGSKNAALPILFASILCNDAVYLYNIPDLRDISTTIKLLQTLGCHAERVDGITKINPYHLTMEAPYELVRTMRASVLCLGPLLARIGKAKVALPGGCAIGARPVDQHLKGFEKLGASFKIEEGYILGECNNLQGNRITLDMPTVGGTENILMGAVLAKGETVIENAAREPEIVDLANFLSSHGAKIEGQGESVIYIQGVDELSGGCNTVMPDRIEAGTFMVASAITRGDIEIENCPWNLLEAVISKLIEMGLIIEQLDNGNLRVKSMGRLESINIKTQPFPGFPTDMQAQIMALAAFSNGVSSIEERIFENRFMHVPELARMGAKIQINGRNAIVQGLERLSGAPVMASDLRASASLVLAGLAADGITEISRIYHLDRGYEQIEKKLTSLGAKIKRISE